MTLGELKQNDLKSLEFWLPYIIGLPKELDDCIIQFEYNESSYQSDYRVYIRKVGNHEMYSVSYDVSTHLYRLSSMKYKDDYIYDIKLEMIGIDVASVLDIIMNWKRSK